jgi:cysteinyl-tRNA synthetase
VTHLEGTFVDALAEADVRAAVAALLALDVAIERRVGAGDDSAEVHSARATVRALIVRLGEAAAGGAGDQRAVVAPYVEAMLELRARARAAQDWATADLLRERLAAGGVEIRDDPTGWTWTLTERPDR